MRCSALTLRITICLCAIFSLNLVSCADKSSSDRTSRVAGTTPTTSSSDGPATMHRLAPRDAPGADHLASESEISVGATKSGDGFGFGGEDGGEGFGEGPDLPTSGSEERAIKQTPQPSGQLTAGEWNDLREWDFWKGLDARNESGSQQEENFQGWGFSSDERVAVLLTSNGRPVVDVPVLLMSGSRVVWQARTDNRGEAELFAPTAGDRQDDEQSSSGYMVQAGSGSILRTARVIPGSARRTRIELPTSVRTADAGGAIDVMFVIDATGSMGDEMEYLKTELGSVIERVSGRVGDQRTIRLSSNYYRDRSDDYVVRSFPFTTDVDKVLQQMSGQSANGGGDVPEAVDAGLADALENHEWSSSATARLLFLVLDAPPHHRPEIASEIQRLTTLAARKGVRIIPVASSGIEKPTEFFLRHLAIMTGGTYVFLTDHSGIGNDHIEPTIGEYKVEYLDDLIERLIVRYSTSVASIADGGVELR